MQVNIQEQFLQYIVTHNLLQKQDRILLAVSGGADSMVLCDLFLKAAIPCGIAHSNFQLRAKEADRDEAFVNAYAEEQKIPFHNIRFSTRQYAEENHLSIEEAARNLRYEWFEKIRKKYAYQFIATAHHRNDNAETLLLNIFRGTGIRGLHGIQPKRDKVIRPLLFLSKADILEYARRQGIRFTTDATNTSTTYTRNFIRHEIVPVIENKFPGIVARLNDNIHRFAEAEQLYDQAISFHRSKLIEKRDDELFIPILKLLKSTPLNTITYEIFKPFNFTYDQCLQIIQLADKTSGKVVYSPTHQLLRDRKWFIISPLQDKDNKHIVIPNEEYVVKAKDLHLTLSVKKAEGLTLTAESNTALLDAGKIQFPLLLRTWEQGDYFYPLGMRKKKKLSRFFIDQKLSLNDKKKVWVLLSGQRIIWVVGMRIDDRFKITPGTKQVLQIKLI